MRGYSYLWLLAIIIIGAFFFAGGQFINEDLEKLGIPSPTPTINPAIGGNPPGGGTSTEWSISATSKGCSTTTPTTAIIDVVIKSPRDGYIMAEIINNGSPTYAWSDAVTVHPTATSLNNEFTKNAGFSTNQWRLSLFEGGTQNGAGKWTGGTPQGTPYTGAATNCN